LKYGFVEQVADDMARLADAKNGQNGTIHDGACVAPER
jgi:hypothetical protein